MRRLDEIKKRLDEVCTKRGLELYDARETFNGHAEADIEFLISELDALTQKYTDLYLYNVKIESQLTKSE